MANFAGADFEVEILDDSFGIVVGNPVAGTSYWLAFACDTGSAPHTNITVTFTALAGFVRENDLSIPPGSAMTPTPAQGVTVTLGDMPNVDLEYSYGVYLFGHFVTGGAKTVTYTFDSDDAVAFPKSLNLTVDGGAATGSGVPSLPSIPSIG